MLTVIAVPCRDQQATLVGAVQGLEGHLKPMLAAWNCSALSRFFDRLSATVEQGCEGMDIIMPQPFTTTTTSSSLATVAGGMICSADPPAAECSQGAAYQQQSRPTLSTEKAERTAGDRAMSTASAEGCEVSEGTATAAQHRCAAAPPGALHEQNVALPELSPPTPAGRNTRAFPATASPTAHNLTGTPAGSLWEEQASPAVPARLAGSGGPQGTAAPECEPVLPSVSPVGPSDAAQQALDSLRAWADSQEPGDPAVSLVLASAAHTAASDLGLSAGVGPLPWPLYLIATRDSFTHHLQAHSTKARTADWVLHLHYLPASLQVLMLRPM